MLTQFGSRAARAQSLISGRAYAGMPATTKQKVGIRIDPDLLILAEQYGVCAIMGNHGLPCVSNWITDKLIEEIRERKKARENKLNYPR
jgi:hypothetical protein